MKKISIGIIGAGLASQNMHLPTLRNIDDVNISWISDTNRSLGEMLAASHGTKFISVEDVERHLGDCDVVLLSIPLGPRDRYYEMLSKHNIAVFAEKPFAINSQDHLKYQSLFSPEKAACGYQRRFFSSFQLVRKILDEEWFGQPNLLKFDVGGRTTRTSVNASYQDLSFKNGGGILVNLGCHVLDLGFYITRTNDFDIEKANIVFDGETDRHVSGLIKLKDASKKQIRNFKLEFNISWLEAQTNTLEIEYPMIKLSIPFGPSGTITVIDKATGKVTGELTAPAGIGATTTNQAFYLQWKEFLTGLSSGAPHDISAQSTLPTAKLIDSLFQEKWK